LPGAGVGTAHVFGPIAGASPAVAACVHDATFFAVNESVNGNVVRISPVVLMKPWNTTGPTSDADGFNVVVVDVEVVDVVGFDVEVDELEGEPPQLPRISAASRPTTMFVCRLIRIPPASRAVGHLAD